MKKSLLFLAACLIAVSTFSQQWVSIRKRNVQQNSQNNPTQIQLISSNQETSVIKFSFDGFKMIPVAFKRMPAVKLQLDQATPLLIKEAPDLLKFTASVIIPDKDKMEIKVIQRLSQYSDCTFKG